MACPNVRTDSVGLSVVVDEEWKKVVEEVETQARYFSATLRDWLRQLGVSL